MQTRVRFALRKTSVGIVWPVIVFSILHFVAAFCALMLMFGNSMARFDSGRPPTVIEATVERIGGLAANVLWFPAVNIAKAAGIHNNLAEWLLMISNSLLWGIRHVCRVSPGTSYHSDASIQSSNFDDRYDGICYPAWAYCR